MSTFPTELVDFGQNWDVLAPDPCADDSEVVGDEPPYNPERPVLQNGEMWLGEDDGDFLYLGGKRMKKPQPGAPVSCACGWPLPIRWSWGECEFGVTAWRSIHPEMEAVLDDYPMLYRVAPWLWTFCRCNGCADRTRGRGRPHKYCGPRCEAVADNARDREDRLANGATPRNRTVMKLTA
ncbi:hypothetical protein [Mycolicibacterium hodleri]|uniref:Uncharacterized protein n=1 Tax=Mycolicibacterium hodleri TaxID=49897 RepID=A0A502E470_9MYCO|nr:hypothetical protein [Mycolicibacterium hodleri]TPG31749.1 hypothetical protein EAH80_22785 [Mycolicibacterium hodleri]